MSLDVYLSVPDGGDGYVTVFSANITHNLGAMADEAGVYGCVWRPEENGIERAEQVVGPLREGLFKMEQNPEHFRKFDSTNGWGLYENFVPWLRRYLSACEKHPRATVSVSR